MGRFGGNGEGSSGNWLELHPGAGERREDKRLEQMELTAL
jgi:hypothetical protein